jgi:hypothetical protein
MEKAADRGVCVCPGWRNRCWGSYAGGSREDGGWGRVLRKEHLKKQLKRVCGVGHCLTGSLTGVWPDESRSQGSRKHTGLDHLSPLFFFFFFFFRKVVSTPTFFDIS